MTIKLNGYSLDANFKITGFDISSAKNIQSEDNRFRHGGKINKYAYYGGMNINISGITNLTPYEKNNVYSYLNYGLVKIEADDKFYIGENKNFLVDEKANGSDWQDFTMNFVCPKPYVYNATTTIFSATLTASTPTAFYTNNSITVAYDDVNFTLQSQNSATTTLLLCGYQPVSVLNDTNGTATMSIGTVSGFDYNHCSVGAIFPTKTYINRCYIYCNTVTQNLIKKSEIRCFYQGTASGVWTKLESDFDYRVLNGDLIARTGKFIEISNINKDCYGLKINYNGSRSTETFVFNDVQTKYYDKMIIPKLYSKATIIGTNDISNRFLINSAKGIITKNNKKDISVTQGQLFKLYPKTTYYGVFSSGTPNLKIECRFNIFNIYEVF